MSKIEKVLIISKFDPRNTKVSGGVNTHLEVLFKIFEDMKVDYEVFALSKLTNFKSLRNVSSNYNVIYINVSIYDSGMIKLFLELLALNSKKKIIVQFHGGRFRDLKYLNYYIVALKLMFKKVDKFLLLSNQQLIEFEEKFAKNKKVIQVPNFINIDNDLQSLKRKNNKLKILFLGRIVEEKGVFDLIEAVKLLEDENLELNIAGGGPAVERLVVLIKDIPNIHYLGSVFGHEKEIVLKENNVFALPTYHPEGFPYSILEAMKYKMPIISTDVGAIKNLVRNNYNGFIIPEKSPNTIAKKILWLSNNKEELQTMGERSYQLVKDNYSIKAGAKLYGNIFKK